MEGEAAPNFLLGWNDPKYLFLKSLPSDSDVQLHLGTTSLNYILL